MITAANAPKVARLPRLRHIEHDFAVFVLPPDPGGQGADFQLPERTLAFDLKVNRAVGAKNSKSRPVADVLVHILLKIHKIILTSGGRDGQILPPRWQRYGIPPIAPPRRGAYDERP